MPRPRMSDWIITPTPVTIVAGGTYIQLLDLIDTFYPQIYFRATWGTTGSPTGLGVKIYRGYSTDAAQDIEYTDAGDTVTVTTQPAINSGTPLTTKNDFAVNAELYPRRIKLIFTNNDASNACTLFISGDR